MNTLQRLEASRKQQPPSEMNFPEGTTHKDFEVHGTLVGGMVSRSKDLTLDVFISLQYIKESKHPINKNVYHHIHAWYLPKNEFITVIAKRR